jgi:hypothetical protein
MGATVQRLTRPPRTLLRKKQRTTTMARSLPPALSRLRASRHKSSERRVTISGRFETDSFDDARRTRRVRSGRTRAQVLNRFRPFASYTQRAREYRAPHHFALSAAARTRRPSSFLRTFSVLAQAGLERVPLAQRSRRRSCSTFFIPAAGSSFLPYVLHSCSSYWYGAEFFVPADGEHAWASSA